MLFGNYEYQDFIKNVFEDSDLFFFIPNIIKLLNFVKAGISLRISSGIFFNISPPQHEKTDDEADTGWNKQEKEYDPGDSEGSLGCVTEIIGHKEKRVYADHCRYDVIKNKHPEPEPEKSGTEKKRIPDPKWNETEYNKC